MAESFRISIVVLRDDNEIAAPPDSIGMARNDNVLRVFPKLFLGCALGWGLAALSFFRLGFLDVLSAFTAHE